MLSKLKFAFAALGVALFASAGAQAATYDAQGAGGGGGAGGGVTTTIENLTLGGGTNLVSPGLTSSQLTTGQVHYYWGLTIVTPPDLQTVEFALTLTSGGLNLWDSRPLMSVLNEDPSPATGTVDPNTGEATPQVSNSFGVDIPFVSGVQGDHELADYDPYVGSEVAYGGSSPGFDPDGASKLMVSQQDPAQTGNGQYYYSLASGTYLLHGFFDIFTQGTGVTITLTAVPVPPAMLLFASGLVGLAAAGRRRWKARAAA